MPILPLQILTATADLLLFIFVGYFLMRLRTKEIELEKKESKLDGDYHHIVNEALAKERKILDDATTQANQIIAGAHQMSNASRETVEQALQRMATDIQKEAAATIQDFLATSKTAKESMHLSMQQMVAETQKDIQAANTDFTQSYHVSIKQVADHSLNDFQVITKALSTDLEAEIKAFQTRVIPGLEKEVEAYKVSRFADAEKTLSRIIQKASQEILHTTVPISDQQNLLIEALEKAKKEGIFE